MKLFVCIFDEAQLLPHFLKHYARSGVSEFHVARPEDLADYITTVSGGYRVVQYGEYELAETVCGGVSAVAGMRERVQGADEWVVIVDLDEFVEFGGPIETIVAQAEAEGANVVRGILYDRFTADGRPTAFDDDSDLSAVFPVRARLVKEVMGGVDHKGVLVKGLLRSKGAHHNFHDERPSRRKLEISHYKWNDPTLRRTKQAYEMSRAAGRDWSIEYKRVLDHYASHGRFAWETFGGELTR
jgi:hypothetical protein